MITVLLPIMDRHDITYQALDALVDNATGALDIIIVDNGSDQPFLPYTDWDITNLYPNKDVTIRVVRNEVNVAGYGALLQILDMAKSDIVLWMHNDVLIHEKGWDTRILAHFNADSLLGIAGFFGAPGVADNGGRIGSMGNMLGRTWGTPQESHGERMIHIHPAAVFDSLAIIVRLSIFRNLPIDHYEVPPHHWNDRILPLLFIMHGYHAATIGIAFDHHGGISSLGNKYLELAERWSREHGLPMKQDWDYTFYHAGERYFRKLGGKRFPLFVHSDYRVSWGNDD